MSINQKIIFLFFLSFSCFSQERELLKGKILADSLDGAAINILNLSSGMGTTNDTAGNFEILARVEDTLVFSSVQYETRQIVISEELLKKAFLGIMLKEKLNELDAVSISNISLDGNLHTDLDKIYTFTQADIGFPMSDVPKPTSIERKLHTASGIQKDSKENPPGMVNISLDGILNRMNGRTAMLEKAAANEDLSQLVDKGVASMPVIFFVEDLQVPEEYIRDFIYYCARNSRFASLLPDHKKFELIEYFQLKAPGFRKQSAMNN